VGCLPLRDNDGLALGLRPAAGDFRRDPPSPGHGLRLAHRRREAVSAQCRPAETGSAAVARRFVSRDQILAALSRPRNPSAATICRL